jgi:hypothetical protein
MVYGFGHTKGSNFPDAAGIFIFELGRENSRCFKLIVEDLWSAYNAIPDSRSIRRQWRPHHILNRTEELETLLLDIGTRQPAPANPAAANLALPTAPSATHDGPAPQRGLRAATAAQQHVSTAVPGSPKQADACADAVVPSGIHLARQSALGTATTAQNTTQHQQRTKRVLPWDKPNDDALNTSAPLTASYAKSKSPQQYATHVDSKRAPNSMHDAQPPLIQQSATSIVPRRHAKIRSVASAAANPLSQQRAARNLPCEKAQTIPIESAPLPTSAVQNRLTPPSATNRLPCDVPTRAANYVARDCDEPRRSTLHCAAINLPSGSASAVPHISVTGAAGGPPTKHQVPTIPPRSTPIGAPHQYALANQLQQLACPPPCSNIDNIAIESISSGVAPATSVAKSSSARMTAVKSPPCTKSECERPIDDQWKRPRLHRTFASQLRSLEAFCAAPQ